MIFENKSSYLENPFQISRKRIYIWAADLSKESNQLDKFSRILSQDELEKAESYKFEKDKKYFITTRGILRKIISAYLSIQPEKIKFFYNPYGKPYVKMRNRQHSLNFNVSHAGDLALYIFALDRKVGIDLEKVYPIKDFELIARQFFSSSEYIKLTSIPISKRLRAFFRCWTRKEAFIKAIGNGLNYPLKEFEVSLKPNEPTTLLSIKGDPSRASKWSLHSLMPLLNYEAAFVFQKSSNKIEVVTILINVKNTCIETSSSIFSKPFVIADLI